MARAHLLTLGWALALLVLLLAPASTFPPGPPGVELPPFADKLAHALAFGLLGCFALRSAARSQICSRPWLCALAFVLAWGALTESLQGLTATRTPELLDLLADLAGGLLAMVACSRRSAAAQTPK